MQPSSKGNSVYDAVPNRGMCANCLYNAEFCARIRQSPAVLRLEFGIIVYCSGRTVGSLLLI